MLVDDETFFSSFLHEGSTRSREEKYTSDFLAGPLRQISMVKVRKNGPAIRIGRNPLKIASRKPEGFLVSRENTVF